MTIVLKDYYLDYNELKEVFISLFSISLSKNKQDAKIKTLVLRLSKFIKKDSRFETEEKNDMLGYIFSVRKEYRQGSLLDRQRLYNDLCYFIDSLALWTR